MINFIFGAKGCGKTFEIINMLRRDAEAGIPSILIVPEQEAVQAERLTLEQLPPEAQLSLEVLNFSRLYNRVCREYGGLCYSYVTSPLKHIIMWKTLRCIYPHLKKYSASAESDPAFVGTMLSTVSELKYAAVLPDELHEASRRLERSDSDLAHRLSDVSDIYALYNFNISQGYTDSADDLARLCEMLDKHDFFKGKNVYLDSFTSFTALEHKVIERAFATADNVTVTIPLPSKSFSNISTASIEDSLKRLKTNANKWGGHTDTVLSSVKREVSSPITYLSENLWELGVSVDEADRPSAEGCITLSVCDSPYAEAEHVASHIRRLIIGGARYRDIVIIARDASKYKGIIDPALALADIPYFFSEKTDICSLAPVKFLLTVLRIRQYNWRRNDVIAHLKTGLCSVSLREADIFEEYINTWSISGERFAQERWTMNPDGFSARISQRGKEMLAVANEVRERLCAPLTELFIKMDASDNMPELCRAIYEYLEQVALEEKTLELARRELSFGNKKTASELVGAYGMILKTLASVGETLSDIPASVDDLYSVLRLAFEQTDIGTIPTSVDEVVIGSASLLRSNAPKYVFVLGLCEGEFPASVDDTGLIGYNDRELLVEVGLDIGGNEDIRSSDELMFVSQAFSAPSKGLYLSYPTTDGKGGKRSPSLPFRRVEKLFCDASPQRIDTGDLSELYSARVAAAHIRGVSDTAQRQALTQAVADHIPSVTTLSSAPISTDECRIDPETVRNIVGNRIYISPSSLEKYVKCPFSYYAGYMLALREPKKGSFGANHMGDFIHFLMEHMIKYIIDKAEESVTPTKEELCEETERLVTEYLSSLDPDGSLRSPRMEHLYGKLRKLSTLIIESTLQEFGDSDFRPAFFELRIDGKEGNPSPLTLSLDNGAELVLRGFIDRVDVWKHGGKVYVRILDYKTGSKEFNLSDLQYGLGTQMLLYLFAVCASPGANFREATGLSEDQLPIPAGVVYLSSAIPKKELHSFAASEEEILDVARDSLKRSGLILNDENVLYAMSHSASPDFLLGITQKDGVPTGKALVSEESFQKIYSDVRSTLMEIGSKIYQGIADCIPTDAPGQDPCKYCTVRPMCRKNQTGGRA